MLFSGVSGWRGRLCLGRRGADTAPRERGHGGAEVGDPPALRTALEQQLPLITRGMADAVEDAAGVCYGISNAYKESVNCRMEAQYGLQKKKPLIPLLLVEGYEADGWLGLMLGTSV